MSVLFEASVERIGEKEGLQLQFRWTTSLLLPVPIPDYTSAVALTLETIGEPYRIGGGRGGVQDRSGERLHRLRRAHPGSHERHGRVPAAGSRPHGACTTAISIFRKLLPDTPLVGLFETHFHERTFPPEAYLYGIPYEYYEKYGVRKYGFHGASHRFVSARARELFGVKKIISCHLGGSSSVCAVKDGWSVDTSMGMSPQCGLLNAKRVGDLDPYALLYIMEKEGFAGGNRRES